MKFTHVTDREDFPELPPEAMEPENDFDYSLWDDYETDVYLCNAPWGTSEVIVGMSSVGGLGKVVKFADDAARDAYFDSLAGKLKLTSPYRGFSQTSLQVGVPFDVAMQYNYLYLEYNPAAVTRGYAGVDGVRRIYYFIRDVVYRSPSNTEILLQLDYWTTFVNSVTVTHIGLERGHYPLAAVSVNRYLANPRENCALLGAPDVVGSGGAPVRKTAATVDLRGGDQYALVVSTASLRMCAQTPDATKSSFFYTETTPSMYACAVPVAQLDALMVQVHNALPHYFATIQGVYVVAGAWLDMTGGSFDVGGVTVYDVRPTAGEVVDTVALDRAAFPVDATKYRNLSKLYTWPYSWLEVTDYRGNVTEVRIESTAGQVAVQRAVSIAAPWVQLGATLLGTGGAQRQTMQVRSIAGTSYITDGASDLLQWSWDIPCYAVQLDPETAYLTDNRYPRLQQQTALGVARDNAYLSAQAAKTNADRSATNAQAVGNRSAQAAKDNVVNANVAMNDNAADTRAMLSIHVSNAQSTANNLNEIQEQYMIDSYNAQIAWVEASTSLGTTYAAASANLGAAQGATSGMIGGALQGAIAGGGAGPGGIAAGAVAGLASAGIGAAINTTFVDQTNALLFANSEDMLDVERGYIEGNGNRAIQLMYDQTAEKNANQTRERQNENTLNSVTMTRSINASNAAAELARATTVQNNLDTLNTALANNALAYDTATDIADNAYNLGLLGLERELAQAKLGAPAVSGAYSGDGAQAATKPTGLMISVCSQNAADIATAGEAFLRYGVYLNQWVEMTDWQPLEKYCFWKAYDLITEQTELPDAFTDRIKALLLGGVTVYNNPDDILTATPYNNGL